MSSLRLGVARLRLGAEPSRFARQGRATTRMNLPNAVRLIGGASSRRVPCSPPPRPIAGIAVMSLETVPSVSPAKLADTEPDRPLSPLPAHWRSLGRAFVHRARAQARRAAFADSKGTALSYGETFLRAAALGRALARELGPEPYVGLMLPPTVHAAVVNVAVTLLGKIPVNLNYTANQGLVDASIDQC